MAVGAGSIRRAAKANAEVVKSVEEKPEEAVKAVEADTEKPVTKKAPAKKTVNKKATSVKETSAKEISTDKKETSVKQRENATNQVCHITEDLPIYLL